MTAIAQIPPFVPHFTDEESREISLAFKRLSSAFSCGSSWLATVDMQSAGVDDFVDDDEDVESYEVLAVVNRGRVIEQAGVRVEGSPVRRFQQWSVHSGTAAVPTVEPDTDGRLALGFGGLSRAEELTLRTFALECEDSWRLLRTAFSNPIAADDAMARIQYRVAGVSIDARARQLRIRTSSYSEITRRAEYKLRAWLVSAARKYNLAIGDETAERTAPIGRSQGNGFALSTFWKRQKFPARTIPPDQAFVIGDGFNLPHARHEWHVQLCEGVQSNPGTDLHPASDLISRGNQSSSNDSTLLFLEQAS